MATILALALLLQARDPLADGWTKMRDAWKAAREAGGDEDYVADRLIEAAARLHAAIEASGLSAKELSAERVAIKRALKVRLVPAVKTKMPSVDAPTEREREMEMIIEALRERRGLESKKTAGELLTDLGARAQEWSRAKEADRPGAEARAAELLTQLGVLPKGAAPWLRRRVSRVVLALECGADYPAPARPSDALRARIAKLVDAMGGDDPAERDRAYDELVEIGEAAVPQIEEAATSEDAEIRARARKLLGIKE